jgi:hypothetical protein
MQKEVSERKSEIKKRRFNRIIKFQRIAMISTLLFSYLNGINTTYLAEYY